MGKIINIESMYLFAQCAYRIYLFVYLCKNTSCKQCATYYWPQCSSVPWLQAGKR